MSEYYRGELLSRALTMLPVIVKRPGMSCSSDRIIQVKSAGGDMYTIDTYSYKDVPVNHVRIFLRDFRNALFENAEVVIYEDDLTLPNQASQTNGYESLIPIQNAIVAAILYDVFGKLNSLNIDPVIRNALKSLEIHLKGRLSIRESYLSEYTGIYGLMIYPQEQSTGRIQLMIQVPNCYELAQLKIIITFPITLFSNEKDSLVVQVSFEKNVSHIISATCDIILSKYAVPHYLALMVHLTKANLIDAFNISRLPGIRVSKHRYPDKYLF